MTPAKLPVTLTIRPYDRGYRVYLTVGVQTFDVGPVSETYADVLWFRRMLRDAMESAGARVRYGRARKGERMGT